MTVGTKDGICQTQDTADLRVGKVRILTGDIFSQAEIDSSSGALSFIQRAMNDLSFDTRPHVLRKELLFKEGDPYDPALLAETERNLRELGFLNNVTVAAVDTTDGLVDIEVHTRESWTLQASLAYARGSNGDTRWNLQLSEKNFLGYGVTLGAGLGADENATYWNFWFRNRRFTRHHLRMGVDYSQRDDGHYKSIFLRRPYFSQDDPWTAEINAWDSLGEVRHYLSNAGPAGIDPAGQASLYAKIPTHYLGLQLVFQKRVSPRSRGRIWRLGAGGRLVDQDVRLDEQQAWVLSDGRLADLDYLLADDQPLGRDQGVEAHPFLWLNTLGRTWVKSRFVLQFGPVEDIPLDWNLNLTTGPNGARMGSTRGNGSGTWLTEAAFSHWWKHESKFALLSGNVVWQAGEGVNGYHRYEVVAGLVSLQGPENHPWITRVFAEYADGRNLAGNQALLLGLDRGMRTLDFDGRAGDRLVRWNLEQGKAAPWEVFDLFRVGGAVFYNGGNSWWRDESRTLDGARHELGFGLRLGPTRSGAAQTSRFDISWALDGSVGPVFTASSRGLF